MSSYNKFNNNCYRYVCTLLVREMAYSHNDSPTAKKFHIGIVDLIGFRYVSLMTIAIVRVSCARIVFLLYISCTSQF